jgi:hypothetical protein
MGDRDGSLRADSKRVRLGRAAVASQSVSESGSDTDNASATSAHTSANRVPQEHFKIYPTEVIRARVTSACGAAPIPVAPRGRVQFVCDLARTCGGFGDRLRGMTALWIDAMDEGASFEAFWARPIDMDAHGILKVRPGRRYRPPQKRDHEPNLMYDTVDAVPLRERKCKLKEIWSSVLELNGSVSVRTNANMPHKVLHGQRVHELPCTKRPAVVEYVHRNAERLFGCAFWDVFTIGDTMQRALDRVISQHAGGRFPAVHIRAGDSDIKRHAKAHLTATATDRERWFAAVRCAADLGRAAGLGADAKVFVATDSTAAKKAIREMFGAAVIMHDVPRLVHIDRGDIKDPVVVVDALVDLFLLAAAECVVATHLSGFSRSAAALAGRAETYFVLPPTGKCPAALR